MLLEGALGTLDGRDMLGVLDDLGDGLLVLRSLDELVQTSILGSQDKEGDAKEGIGTRGEDGDLALVALDGLAIGVAQGKVDLGASERPIQLACICLTRSGQPGSFSRSSSSSWEYSVIL